MAALSVALVSLHSTRQLLVRLLQFEDQRVCLDRQLIQSQKLASIGELSSGIAHEINNPLAVIAQEVELLRHLIRNLGSNGEELIDVNDSLREIAHQVNRCREITHKLLDFARKSEPLIQSTDVNKLVEDMARLVEIEAGPKRIRIERDYDPALPAARTDPPLLRQVILNLLNNATYAVGKDGTVTVKTRALGDNRLRIEVSDTGCGIDPDCASKIFDPFFTTKPPGKGTGLGLSICHNIITRLGGRITVASEPGKGAAFTIELPLKPS